MIGNFAATSTEATYWRITSLRTHATYCRSRTLQTRAPYRSLSFAAEVRCQRVCAPAARDDRLVKTCLRLARAPAGLITSPSLGHNVYQAFDDKAGDRDE